MNKNVLLAVTHLNGAEKCIEKNLKFLGYNVTNLSYDERGDYYPNLLSRLQRFYYKKILRDKKKFRYHKKSRLYTIYQEEIEKKLKSLYQKADLALFFRADAYPFEMVEKVCQYANKSINFQWDGLSRFPDAVDYIPLFSQYYIFDQTDINRYSNLPIKFIPNFYFDYPIEYRYQEREEGIHRLYYIGTHNKSRIEAINIFLNLAEQKNLNLDFTILGNNANQDFNYNKNITYLTENNSIPFEENIIRSRNCDIIVDFHDHIHKGLSFRVLESVGYGKKLITTNETVINYDFYHPNNILIWDQKDINAILDFIEKPFMPIPDKIRNKYSFTSWLEEITKAS